MSENHESLLHFIKFSWMTKQEAFQIFAPQDFKYITYLVTFAIIGFISQIPCLILFKTNI